MVFCHPELVSGSPGFSDGMLKQVQQDELLVYRFVGANNYSSLLVSPKNFKNKFFKYQTSTTLVQ